MTVGREDESLTACFRHMGSSSSAAVIVSVVLLITVGMLTAACIDDGVTATPTATVANPTAQGVACSSSRSRGDAASDCRRTFDQCSDGLRYELACVRDACVCIVDGVQQGEYRSSEASCDVDIGRMKVLCGWNLPDGRERAAAP